MPEEINILSQKIESFIRKYYKNQIIRGGIWSASLLLVTFLISVILEYFGQFDILIRTIIFYAYLSINVPILLKLIIIPFLKLKKIGPYLSFEKASIVVGKFFPEIKDKLLNTLLLKDLAKSEQNNLDLIIASIDQKIQYLKPIQFNKAINYNKNKKYLIYLFIPLFIFIGIFLVFPTIITGSTKRLIYHDQYFPKEVPYVIDIQNSKLQAIQQDDFTLQVKLKGKEAPKEIFVEYNGANYLLDKQIDGTYQYIFKKVQKNIPFHFVTDEFSSEEYILTVIPKPIILNFSVELKYPTYINKPKEVLQNSGDITVPEGTQIEWHFNTRDTKFLNFSINKKTEKISEKNTNAFSITKQLFQSCRYSIISQNLQMLNKDSLAYSIQVNQDQYPVINVNQFSDSIYDNRLYFKGEIKDDYGFTKLMFSIKSLKTNEVFSTKVPVSFIGNQQEFYYFFDLSTLKAKDGNEFEYYFEIWDNDGVNGNKFTKSNSFSYKLPTESEIEKLNQERSDNSKNEIEKLMNDIKKLQKDVDEVSKNQINKNNSDFENKKQIQNLIKNEKTIENKLNELKKTISENNIKESIHKEYDEELINKQKELEKLFNDLMNEDLRNLMKELEKMMENIDKKQVNQMLDKIKSNNEDLKKELDRNLELFKQLEVEKKLNDQIKKLESLSEEQKKLSEETMNLNKDNAATIQSKQDEIQKKFDEIQKEIKEIEKKNSELENPKDLKNTDNLQKEIQKEIQNSSTFLKDKKEKKSSQSQKNAGDKMDELSKKLNESLEESQNSEQEEDIQSIRMILKNLLKVSFNQENLMAAFKSVNVNDPQYVKLSQNQYKLKEDLEKIKDSIYAISKRQVKIQSFVNKEISNINNQTETILDALKNRNISVATSKQQYVMTSVNNLALLLAESLDDMQKQQNESKQKKSGKCNKSCKKPGSGKPSASTMKKLQDQLNKQMEQMKSEMGKNGKSLKTGQSMSQQLAKMAAQQEAIRKQMQQYAEDLKKEGTGNNSGLNKIMKDMEKTETELVNKVISSETLNRQKEILTRLLESEKAEIKKEMEEKRESNEAKNTFKGNPVDFFKYNNIKVNSSQLYKTIPPTLKPYYKTKVNEFYLNL